MFTQGIDQILTWYLILERPTFGCAFDKSSFKTISNCRRVDICFHVEKLSIKKCC